MNTTLNMKKLVPGLMLLAMMATLSPATVQAQLGGIGLGIKAGTTGFGADVTTSLSKKFNARVGSSFYSYELDGVMDDQEVSIAYDAEMSMFSLPVLVDFFPANRGFRVTAGFHYHDFGISGTAAPNESYTIDNRTFSPEKMGSLSMDLGYQSNIMPYVGLGFGNSIADRGNRLKFTMDLGALYSNSPEFTMSGTGMIAPTADQAPELEQGLQDFQFFPVFNIGISYRIL